MTKVKFIQQVRLQFFVEISGDGEKSQMNEWMEPATGCKFYGSAGCKQWAKSTPLPQLDPSSLSSLLLPANASFSPFCRFMLITSLLEYCLFASNDF